MKNKIHTKLSYSCRICNNSELEESYYPEVHYNNHIFNYYNCEKCESFNVYPCPDMDDLKKMYGEESYSYLNKIENKREYSFDFPFGNHQGYQIKFLKQLKSDLKGKTLLDYGCGGGGYMKYAENLGANVIGVEYDEKYIKLLREKTDFSIITFEQALEKYKNEPFDFIHLGHVLEHLDNPAQILKDLKQLAHRDTVFIIDGPLERNNNMARFYVDLGSRIKSKKYNEFTPEHLTLTTQRSQLLFFEKLGLTKQKYIVTEQYFPLPSELNKSLGSIISYLIATLSILVSRLIPSSGNIFHYRGKF